MDIKILTLNTHKGFSWLNRRFVLPQLRDAIRAIDADLVFLQEVVGENSLKKERHDQWPDSSQYEYLADSIWSDYAYGKNAVYSAGHHGNAILSKFEIHRSEKIDISTNKLEQRGILHCTIDLPRQNTILHCICVHLGLFPRSRKKQYAMIRQYLREKCRSDEPVIIAGDFNEWNRAKLIRFEQDSALVNAQLSCRGTMRKTFPSWYPILALDSICLRGLHPLATDVLHDKTWSRLSDHAPLAAHLRF